MSCERETLGSGLVVRPALFVLSNIAVFSKAQAQLSYSAICRPNPPALPVTNQTLDMTIPHPKNLRCTVIDCDSANP
jgi:hypothetical protein